MTDSVISPFQGGRLLLDRYIFKVDRTFAFILFPFIVTRSDTVKRIDKFNVIESTKFTKLVH